MFRKYYSELLTSHSHTQYYGLPSSLCWPDVAKNLIFEPTKFEEITISLKELIAKNLNINNKENIVFSTDLKINILKLLNVIKKNKSLGPLKILTSDSENFNLDKLGVEVEVEIEKIATHPFDDFETNLINKAKLKYYDVIFVSQVFHNSGMAIKDLRKITDSIKGTKTILVIDGSLGFMNYPTDLSNMENQCFYFAKTFFSQRPEDENDCAFIISSIMNFDDNDNDNDNDNELIISCKPLYRLESVLKLFNKENITVDLIHSHIQNMQNNFRNHLLDIDHHYLTEKNILSVDYQHHGNFLTFAMPSSVHAKDLNEKLKKMDIVTNCNESRLEFHFGIYQKDCINLSTLIEKS
jgi:hypothetical protein